MHASQAGSREAINAQDDHRSIASSFAFALLDLAPYNGTDNALGYHVQLAATLNSRTVTGDYMPVLTLAYR